MDSKGKRVVPVFLAVAVISYIFYIITGYVVLLLSRYREYMADMFSVVETERPRALSTSLVKIAYGLVLADTETKKKLEDKNIDDKQKRKLRQQNGMNYGLRSMARHLPMRKRSIHVSM